MFGYVSTDTPEMKLKEYEYYRAVYCGLCRAQGKCTGQCSRLSLSYDMAFLALLRMAVHGDEPKFATKRCIVHPTQKRPYVIENEQLDYCAYATILLSYGKIEDNIKDEKGFKRLFSSIVKIPYKGFRKKALKDYSELDSKIREGLSKLSEIENEHPESVDKPALIFGEILAEVASYGFEGSEKKILYNIGKHIGKWVYIADAADDLSDDIKKGRYNPFYYLYDGKQPEGEEIEDIYNAMKLELIAAEPAIDLIEFGDREDMKNIIFNIVYKGLPKKQKEILYKKNKKDSAENGSGN